MTRCAAFSIRPLTWPSGTTAGRADEARPVIAALDAETAVTPSATLARHLSYARAVLADDDHAEEEFTKALRAPAILSVG